MNFQLQDEDEIDSLIVEEMKGKLNDLKVWPWEDISKEVDYDCFINNTK